MPELFSPLYGDDRNRVIYVLHTNPYATLDDLYDMAGVGENFFRDTMNIYARNRNHDLRNTRVYAFVKYGYINIPHPDTLNLPMRPNLYNMMLAVHEHPSASNADLARLTLYSHSSVRLRLRELRKLTGFKRPQTNGTSSFTTRLKWYEHMGWFDADEMADDVERQYALFMNKEKRNEL